MIAILTILVLCIIYQSHANVQLQTFATHSSHLNPLKKNGKSSFDKLLIRGGKYTPKKKNSKKVDDKKKTKKGLGLKEQFNKVKPATRCYMILSLICMLIHISGLPAPALLSVDITKFYQLWRPFTSVAYFGAPSLSTANSIYFLIQYGQQLETLNGTGAHAWFLLVQTFILSTIGMLFNFPMLSQAMIAATVYASCRLNPMQRMPFQFGLMITSWQLPYCMMAIDCLSQQNPSAAWPHVLGIFSGHVYHFFTTTWPNLGGKARLLPPKWFINRLGGPPVSNVEEVDFKSKKDKYKNKSKSTPKKKYGKANVGTIFNT